VIDFGKPVRVKNVIQHHFVKQEVAMKFGNLAHTCKNNIAYGVKGRKLQETS
jgi:hypothetical protein